MANGGAMTVRMATGISGGHAATAGGIALSAPAQGGGSVFASAADGSTLHCEYVFNTLSRSGVGVCQDSAGEVFDLQINPS